MVIAALCRHLRAAFSGVSEGRFYGERLNGRINPGTGDWMLTRNGIRVVDARIVLLCDDDAIIHMSYGGRIWFDESVLPALASLSTRHLIDPSPDVGSRLETATFVLGISSLPVRVACSTCEAAPQSRLDKDIACAIAPLPFGVSPQFAIRCG